MKKDTCNSIILTAEPRGVYEECVISGTPKPGTFMEIVPDTNPVGGRFTYRAVSRLDGQIGPVCILLEDKLQGANKDTAYVSGARGFMYWPVAGEEFLALFRDQPGTGTSLANDIGDLLEIDGASGMLQGVGTSGATGSHESKPFHLMEHLGVDLTANTLIWVKYRGNQG